MFSSIKYRFILIYVALLLISMSIVGTFIIKKLKDIQIENTTVNMEKTLDSFANTTGNLFSEDLASKRKDFARTINDWGFPNDQAIYIIDNSEIPKIIATNRDIDLKSLSALSYRGIEPSLILKAKKSETAQRIVENENDKLSEKHIAKPVISSEGKLVGIIYMSQNLQKIYEVVDDSKVVITYATIISLLITLVIGYFIANSVTTPIRDVTKKARQMARGDFNQKVDIKSNDEIGQLGNMFNYLTRELSLTIGEMTTEKSKLNAIFNHMAEGVVAVDKNGRLIGANSVARKILNVDESDINKDFDLKKIDLEISFEDEESLNGEKNFEKDGFFYKLKYAPYISEEGNSGIIVVFADITKEHNLEVMRREFVANVSHELKTPITTISSYAETLIENELDRQTNIDFLDVIIRENDRMNRIVEDLLKLSNLDYSDMDLDFEELDINLIIKNSLRSLKVMAEKKSHNIELKLNARKKVNTDYHLAESVLTNIISNSIKYTKNCGNISIETEDLGNCVKIAVRDDGIGIPKEDLDRIFERFYRVEKGRSRRMGGTGLGLSIVKGSLEKLGGTIALNSIYGEGTEVVMTLPVKS